MRKLMLFPLSLVFLEIGTYLANDMYLPGLPTIAQNFDISQDAAQYTLLVWFLGSASMQLFTGPISDRFGRRIVLLSGALLFFISSIVCAITSNLNIMLFARFIQGCTIGAIVVPGYAAVHELYDTNAAIKIIAIMSSVTILAPAFGPLLGAIVIEISHWRLIFWGLAVWGMLAYIILYRVMPETNLRPVPIDIRKVLTDYIRILIRASFLKYILTFSLLFLAFICWIVESPFIIIETRGVGGIEFGIIQLLIFGCFLIGAQLTRVLIDYISVQVTIWLGLFIACIGALALSILVQFELDSLYSVVVAMMCVSLGASMTFSPLNRCAIEACKEPMGSRTAISSTLIGCFGVLGTVLVTVFNDKTLENLSYLVVFGILSAVMVYSVLTFYVNHKSKE